MVLEAAAHTGASPADNSVTEGATLLARVSLNAASPVASEYVLALGGTAATADLDALSFSGGVAWKNGDAASGIVVVPAGVTAFTVAIPTVDDAIIEHAESVVLTVGGVSASGTVEDNDVQSVRSMAAFGGAVVEGAALLTSVVLSAPGVAATEYAVALGGTASAADLAGLSFTNGVAWKDGSAASGIIVVPAGVAGFGVAAATVDDALVEVAETIALTIGTASATGTILDLSLIHI